MAKANRVCPECGNAHSRKGAFCSTSCRQAFNNRRLQRGAEVYDLLRAMRRERDKAKALNVWTEICRLELRWNTEDEAERPGRRSYIEPRRALNMLMDAGKLSRGEVLVRSYLSGQGA